MKEEILQKIRDIINDLSEFNAQELNFETSLMDINLSSIEMMSALAEIQRAYNITISTDDLMTIETIKDMVDLIEMKIA
jgi:acyl carrier protein